MKKFLFLICLALAILLMALPWSATLMLASSPTTTLVKTYSYFDFVVFGTGNFFPLITAVLGVVALGLMLLYLFRVRGGILVEVFLWLSVLSSAAALLFAMQKPTALGICHNGTAVAFRRFPDAVYTPVALSKKQVGPFEDRPQRGAVPAAVTPARPWDCGINRRISLKRDSNQAS